MPGISAPMFQTKSDLSHEVRQRMVELLNRQLAETFDLYSQTKHAHWNVKGSNFFQLHELFDELAEGVFKFIDLIAERATALGGYANGTIRMAAADSGLPEYPRDAIDGRQHVEALIERYSKYAASSRKAIDMAQDEDDMATADLFTDVAREIDKSLWFLEAHLQGAAQKAG
ncbi:MAG TPA: DNA starvation/stationary phase protection protein Dps [Bryobacteraceae bacterium]|nr:DNA starvation/stationary phase protection protein Dps [Bryobacteraceae bacterium]HPQ14604.1 DNA starvation/stationary phase protection protein Dps [Bryobacteraceae bacterium]